MIRIDGKNYSGVSQIYRSAVTMGFIGCRNVIYRRVKGGCTTWREVLSPCDESLSKRGKLGGAATAKSKKTNFREQSEEMAVMCAELDARKAAIEGRS